MDTNVNTETIPMTGPKVCHTLNGLPSMGWVFLKAFGCAIVRPNTIKPGTRIQPYEIRLDQYNIDPKRLLDYCGVCGFSQDPEKGVPLPFFQSLFVGLFGKFITSEYFPINPLGLIHVFQSLKIMRKVHIGETLDLTCKLSSLTQTPKGIESNFKLEVHSEGELVWQGISVFLTKTPQKQKKSRKPFKPEPFEPKEQINVPTGTGRRYAKVSKDYNPHHMYDLCAKAFGFKKAIAHGMWSLARTIAGLDQFINPRTGHVQIDAYFKRPIFMPATVALGYTKNENEGFIDFQLQDDSTGTPHIKGTLYHQIKEKL